MALFELKQDYGNEAEGLPPPPTFKDCAAADIDTVFFNGNEHADRHIIDGKDVLVVIVEGGTRKWFYFDPNFGLVNFPTEDAMKKGMKESLANSKTPLIPGAFGTPTNPEYTVSTFKASENQSRVHGLVYGSL